MAKPQKIKYENPYLLDLKNFFPKTQEAIESIKEMTDVGILEVEAIQSYCLYHHILTLDDVIKLTNKYKFKNKNLYLLQSVDFGNWGENKILGMDSRLRSLKKNDQNIFHHHDLILEINEFLNIKLEAKCTRPTLSNIEGSLSEKACDLGEKRTFSSIWNHISFDEADIFVFIVVWKNDFTYYVFPKDDMKRLATGKYKSEGEKLLSFNKTKVKTLESYLCPEGDIIEKVIELYKKQKTW